MALMPDKVASRDARWPALIPVVYALLVTVYIMLRFGLRWADSDTAQIVTSTRDVFTQGTIEPVSGAYPHGYAYQAIIVMVAKVTGIGVTNVDLAVLPFFTAVLALAAFLAYRQLTEHAVYGAIAAVLLFIQPEFIFVVERGSHEKVTSSFVILLVLILAATLTRRSNTGSRIAYVFTFYIIAWALISTNSFFGSSYFVSLALALAGGALVLWLYRTPVTERARLNRMIYTVLSGIALVFVFVAYVYSPARYNYGILHSLIDRVSALFLSFDVQSNPYASLGAPTGANWIAPWLYPLLTSFDVVITVASLLVWIWLGYRFWRDGISLTNLNHVLIWLFAAAFAFEVGLSVLVDFSGFLGSNLQIRIFPMFMLFAIPLVVLGLAAVEPRIRIRQRLPAGAAAGVLIVAFAIAGILKATNDPAVSNKWTFHSGSEQLALAWIDRTVAGQEIWLGFDERLRVVQAVWEPVNPNSGNIYVSRYSPESTRYVMDSDVIDRRSTRLGLPVPDTEQDDQILDLGSARVFHQVPRTPYQP